LRSRGPRKKRPNRRFPDEGTGPADHRPDRDQAPSPTLEVTPMKTTMRTLLYTSAALLVILARVPAARADDTQDYINQIYQEQQQYNDYMQSLTDTQNYINQIYQDQQQQNDYMQSLNETQQYINQINNPGG
jgi:hypothetical protein